MAIWTTSLRLLAFWSLAIWIGGFTFYSAVVIPVLHDQLGSALETGLVTQRVTDLLNLLSLVTIVLGWIRAALERPRGDRGRTGWRGAVLLLAIITLCLVALVFLHRRLDGRLLSGRWQGFTRSIGLTCGSAPSSGWPAWFCCRSGPVRGAAPGSRVKEKILKFPPDRTSPEFPAQSIQARERARPIERLSRLFGRSLRRFHGPVVSSCVVVTWDGCSGSRSTRPMGPGPAAGATGRGAGGGSSGDARSWPRAVRRWVLASGSAGCDRRP